MLIPTVHALIEVGSEWLTSEIAGGALRAGPIVPFGTNLSDLNSFGPILKSFFDCGVAKW